MRHTLQRYFNIS